MIIELAFALLLQSAEPVSVACNLEVETRGRGDRQRIDTLYIFCPTDVENAEALQATADAAASLVDKNRIRHAGLMTASAVYFEQMDDGSWQAEPGQIIASIPATMPARLMIDGYDTMSCAWAALPDYRGRLRLPEISCYVDGRTRPVSVIRRAEEMVEELLRNTLLLPVTGEYCLQDEVRVVSTVIDVTGGRYNNDNDREPDMRRLPNMCR